MEVAQLFDPAVFLERAAPLLLAALADVLEGLPGVVGGAPEACEFAAAWTTRTGAVARVDAGHGVYALERVVPPRPADGGHRAARRPRLRAGLRLAPVQRFVKG